MAMEKAILAGGCFWGMEDLIRGQPGVVDTRVGYTGGDFENPTYKDMTAGKTGHAEAVEITFDPAVTSYRRILEFFFQIHDPTTANRQGNDRGAQYRSAIFTMDDGQAKIAKETIRDLDKSRKWPGKIVTEIRPAAIFYEAEDYHQDYLQKNIGGYTCHWVRPDWVI
jgi:peptide-methionine (S)-S-oxide reductase